MTYIVVAVLISLALFFALLLYYDHKLETKRNANLDKEINDIILNHNEFLKSLSVRQLEYYSSMDHKHLSREILKLEQRIYDLEKPNLPY